MIIRIDLARPETISFGDGKFKYIMDEQILFADRNEFHDWLLKHHDSGKGIWLVFGKNESLKTVKPDEALEEALCFGWIDGQITRIDDEKYIKKFTPRRRDSKWSERNRQIAARLISDGKMTEPGMAAIEHAKNSGAWDTPKQEPVTDEQVDILIEALQGAEPALSNFMNMSPSVRRTYTTAYLDAKKEETRKRRMQWIIERLNKNLKPM